MRSCGPRPLRLLRVADVSTIPAAVTTAIEDALDAAHSAGYDLGRSDQAADDRTAYAALEAEFAAYRERNPETPPPPARTVFSVYAGPATKGGSGQTSTTRARVCKAFGIPEPLPVDRVYSSTDFGKAASCPSPHVAVSYGQVVALARGTSTVINALKAEFEQLAVRTGQTFDVSCDHEVDSKIRKGSYTAAQVEDAHGEFASILDSVAAPNLRHALCCTGYVFQLGPSDPSHPDHYYAVGVYQVGALDPYWSNGKRSVDDVFDPAFAWVGSKGLIPATWETGVSVDPEEPALTVAELTRRTEGIADYFERKPVAYSMWFESARGNNYLENTPSALAVWAERMQAQVTG